MNSKEENKKKRAFDFVQLNQRAIKPRRIGLTEIRGPYYAVMGKRYLQDILETMGDYVDSLKYSGGSFSLMSRKTVKEMNGIAHDYGLTVSTGGFLERILAKDPSLVDQYIHECRELDFDIIEISTGFISIPSQDWIRLIEKVCKAELKAKPEVGIQFGAGGDSPIEELEKEGLQDVENAIQNAKKFLEAGAYMIMIESEGITENVRQWRTEVPAKFINQLGLDKLMFEAADPSVFEWYIKNYGPEVNLFIDHSQIVQLEALRSGIWGTKDLWGRVVTFKG